MCVWSYNLARKTIEDVVFISSGILIGNLVDIGSNSILFSFSAHLTRRVGICYLGLV